MKDYYHTLNVSPDTSMEQIQQAYKKLSMKYHPDKNRSSDTTHQFQEISEAYQVLGNYHSRRQYDDNREVFNLPNFEDPFAIFEDFSKHLNSLFTMTPISQTMMMPIGQRMNGNGKVYMYTSSQATSFDPRRGSQTKTITHVNNNGKQENFAENIIRDKKGNIVKRTETKPKTTPRLDYPQPKPRSNRSPVNTQTKQGTRNSLSTNERVRQVGRGTSDGQFVARPHKFLTQRR